MTGRRALLLATLWLLGGCSSTVRLMPTPTLFTGTDAAAVEAGLDIGQDTTIEVLYATNRQPLGPVTSRHYTGMRSEQLRLGVATLKVRQVLSCTTTSAKPSTARAGSSGWAREA